MKTSIKNIVIIFLVALLGAGIGTFSVLKIKDYSVATNNEPLVVSQVQYSNKQETNFTQAIDKVYNTVVEINGMFETTYSSGYFYFGGKQTQEVAVSGSGVIISQDGYIVTNNHVVEDITDDDAIKVKLYNGETYTAKLIGTDARTDLAVIKINETNLPYSSFADSSQLLMGEDVIAIGNPLGLGISCSNGIISALEKEIYINNVYLTVIQTNAAVNEGNSGGGLFDLNGNIVGIVNAKKSNEASSDVTVEGMGYAIPSNTVKRIVSELVENGYVKDRAALGIKVYTGNSYYSEKGVLVTEVVEGGSAWQAGIKQNDIITAVDDTVVDSYADLSKVLDSKSVGDIVKVTLNRNDKLVSVDVVLQQSSSN